MQVRTKPLSEPVRLASPPRQTRRTCDEAGAGRLRFDAHYEAIVERAFALAETGHFVSLASLKQQLKREGFVAVETALRGTHDRRELRALCATAVDMRRGDQPAAPGVGEPSARIRNV